MRSLVIFAVILALDACGPATVTSQKDLSKFACVVRAADLFPDVGAVMGSKDGDSGMGNSNEADVTAGQFRIASTGAFTWNVDGGEFLPQRLSCSGDFNRHTLSSVVYDGVIKRPSASEVWSF